MDIFEAIAKRYSYRGEFTLAPVPRSDLEKIVQAGIQAPSGCNEQVVSFVIIDEAQLLDAQGSGAATMSDQRKSNGTRRSGRQLHPLGEGPQVLRRNGLSVVADTA